MTWIKIKDANKSPTVTVRNGLNCVKKHNEKKYSNGDVRKYHKVSEKVIKLSGEEHKLGFEIGFETWLHLLPLNGQLIHSTPYFPPVK